MHKKFFHFAYIMTFLWQTIFSFVTPLLVFGFVGYLLQSKLGLGKWVLALCIVAGALLGIYSMFHYIVTTVDWATKEDKGNGIQSKKDSKK